MHVCRHRDDRLGALRSLFEYTERALRHTQFQYLLSMSHLPLGTVHGIFLQVLEQAKDCHHSSLMDYVAHRQSMRLPIRFEIMGLTSRHRVQDA